MGKHAGNQLLVNFTQRTPDYFKLANWDHNSNFDYTSTASAKWDSENVAQSFVASLSWHPRNSTVLGVLLFL